MELMDKGFAIMMLDTPLEFDDATNLDRIYGVYAMNESGEMLAIESSGHELGKAEYERLKSFLGDRVMYFNTHNRRDYESLLFSSALSGVAIRNESMSIYVPMEKAMEHPDSEPVERFFLEEVRETILSGSYLDGRNTRDTSDGRFLAHGDVRGLSCTPVKWLVIPCKWLIEKSFSPRYEAELKTMKSTRLIISLSATSTSKRFYLITTDGEGDPACNGLLPILNCPELERIYTEHGLSYFLDWKYRIEDVFSKDIDLEVVRCYLGILKEEKVAKR